MTLFSFHSFEIFSFAHQPSQLPRGEFEVKQQLQLRCDGVLLLTLVLIESREHRHRHHKEVW